MDLKNDNEQEMVDMLAKLLIQQREQDIIVKDVVINMQKDEPYPSQQYEV